jgi:hypothetical protein
MLITEILNTPAQITVDSANDGVVIMNFSLRNINYTFSGSNVTEEFDPGETWEVDFGIATQNGHTQYQLTQTGNAFEVLAAVQQCCLKLIQMHPAIQQIMFTGDKGEGSRTKLYDRLVRSLKIPGWKGSKEVGGFRDFYYFSRIQPRTKRQA